MEIVILESPYAGNVEKNVEYARMCMLDSLKRGESPMVSHSLFTDIAKGLNFLPLLSYLHVCYLNQYQVYLLYQYKP